LHFLEGAEPSLLFLNTVIAQAPKGLRFILLSRTKIALTTDNALYLGNESLAMTPNDVAELFATIFKVTLPFETVAELHRISEGWIMGLILTGNAVLEKLHCRSAEIGASLLARRPDEFWRYFQDEILETLDPSRRLALLALSLLENIPIGLARIVTPAIDSEKLLNFLVQKNYFLRRLEESPACYCFHHLFQEFLRQRAAKELSEREQRIILARAGHWFMRRHHQERALQYYLKAKTYGMAEKILRDIGAQLVATNRTGTFKEILAPILPQAVQPYAWFSFFIASVYMRSDPAQCLTYLEQARQQFVADTDGLGELMATTARVAFHAGVDCRFKTGLPLLARAETLYDALAEKLSVAARIQCGYALAYGLCYFAGNTRKAAQYTDECFTLAATHGLDDAMASTSVARALIRSLEGDWQGYKQDLERAHTYFLSPRVGTIAKLAIRLQELAMLGMEGDSETYQHSRKYFIQSADPDLLAKTIFGAILLTSDTGDALADGRLQEALGAARQGLAFGGSNRSAHMQSQFQAYLAYIHALCGQKPEALAAARESLRLRDESGGAYHILFTQLVIGAAYVHLQMKSSAEPLLSRAISASERMGMRYIATSAYAHRALLYLNTGRTPQALADIQRCLKSMKTAHYRRFLMFNPMVAEKIFCAAVKHGIEPAHARKIALTQLKVQITPAGETIPLLTIRTLGGLDLRIGNEVRIKYSDLTANQRELLALLISAPQNGLSHEIIQDAFWPESPPDKIRSKLDNLLARLRKVFNVHLAPFAASHYLAIERGVVRLQHCDIDVHRFTKEVRQGMAHIKQQERRQAGHAYFRAHRLYQGPFMPGVYLRDPAAYFQENLQQTYRQSACQWAHLLAEGIQTAEAVLVYQKALQDDPTHQPIVKMLYHLLTRSNETIQARLVLADYQKALAQYGFSPQEIEQILDDFWRGG
jgi:ATP/maltotriose-dependent transcriptional regulator MalT/DNA-binding SARP family transcriptional activator